MSRSVADFIMCLFTSMTIASSLSDQWIFGDVGKKNSYYLFRLTDLSNYSISKGYSVKSLMEKYAC